MQCAQNNPNGERIQLDRIHWNNCVLHTPALLKEGIHTHFKTCSFERGQNFECRGVMLKYSRQQSNHSRRTFKKCLGSPDFDRPGEYIGGVYLVILSIYGSQEKRGKKKKEKKRKKGRSFLKSFFLVLLEKSPFYPVLF